MFTLKLYRSHDLSPCSVKDTSPSRKRTLIREATHVEALDIGPRIIELRAFETNGDYKVYYVGEPEPHMDAVNSENNWGWGLLENSNGRTTEHYRPASYGP